LLRDTVMFSSDNTNAKGKRSAANLPVEAEDSLPWYIPRFSVLRRY
jgi:replication factor C subunit 3/5